MGPISNPIPISNALPDSICGRYDLHDDVTFVSIHDPGAIIWAKMYPSVIHLIDSLALKSPDY